ncbi:hypothetical protein HMPREF3050_09355 [Neisseria sp. HMSC065D04]|uniref:NTF2 fold immunity protein n=1 Tax=Neisseria sp. HMSC065D04 TaxID=1739542 RepID=UPI0008A1FDE6|nr:NTF2 fold immunity protein [Neisseria sp. HMSC065D04]OFO29611.1 hypothetical protein HMPREF3050_09355 [Neisseria sp. HMSC065D04]
MKTAHETLAEFIQLMKDFELYWGEILQNYIDEDNFEEFYSEENKVKLSEGIKSIQHKFLSKRALSLKQSRLEALTFRMPPEYNETITSERKISDKKYEIDVLDYRGKKKTYTLVLEDGEWKIDQMGFMYCDKWKKSRQLF